MTGPAEVLVVRPSTTAAVLIPRARCARHPRYVLASCDRCTGRSPAPRP